MTRAKSETALAWLTLASAVVHFLGETYYTVKFGQPVLSLLPDYFSNTLMLLGSWRSLNARPGTGAAPRQLPLFLVSLASVGYEIALTRWFAIVSWSEYGYWVISITMVGIAASGVVLSLAKDLLLARLDRLAPVKAIAQTGAAIGTPAFMPPEQARGRRQVVAARTDLRR